MLGAALVMLAYPLTESALRRMVAEVADRRARGELDALPVGAAATS
jgi:hypothetical protein